MKSHAQQLNDATNGKTIRHVHQPEPGQLRFYFSDGTSMLVKIAQGGGLFSRETWLKISITE